MIASGAKLCIFTDSLLLRAPPTSPMETSTWDSPIDRVNNLWYGVASTQLKLFWPEWATYLKFVPSTRMDQDWQDRALPGREFLSRQPQTRQCVVPNQHRGVALRGMASIRHFRWYTGRAGDRGWHPWLFHGAPGHRGAPKVWKHVKTRKIRAQK